MERLQSLLKEYNTAHLNELNGLSWALQFCDIPFPPYWYKVFSLAQKLPKESRILEIGSGFGLISSIFIYLRYLNFVGYEQDKVIASKANFMLNKLFGKNSCIKAEKYTLQDDAADVLVLVNCVYSEGCTTKDDYMDHLLNYYKQAGSPKHFILEVIDSSYIVEDDNFPYWVRLSQQDIFTMFPNSRITSWQTYHYPENKRTKELYLIETL